ncbi:MAG: hypothetical protein U5R30_16340 [Deltaproteobacteria bacterium]|nr:hypothetical protein [Deltaproteobacteria bacterium]
MADAFVGALRFRYVVIYRTFNIIPSVPQSTRQFVRPEAAAGTTRRAPMPPSGLDRCTGLEGHTDLTQAAAVALEVEGFFDVCPGADQVLPALFLVVPGLCDGADRAAVDAFPASSICEKKIIGAMVGVRLWW